VEAQCTGLPIIARSTSAVPETIGKNQIILQDDPKEYVATINVLYKNKKYLDFLRQNEMENFKTRFAESVLSKQFQDIMTKRYEINI
jgi:glycosyltransferase involved in cell wall biosynthesis